MFEFTVLPPEVNSGRMYTGAGSGPLLAAAAAWGGLAAELHAAAASYASEISVLTDRLWSGPSATAMGNAAAPQLDWLNATAAKAEQAASQAHAAVSAYEAAFAMTVPPAVVAANRALLMTLIATNFLGQNTPAIAATEAHYAEMWAQDATAMYGYAAAAATHSTLEPFSAPPTTVEGGVNQTAALAHLGSSAATDAQTLLSAGTQLLSAGPQALQGVTPSMSAATSGGAAPGLSTTGLATSGSMLGLLQTLVQMGPPPILGQIGSFAIPVSQWAVIGSAVPEISMTEIIFGAELGWPATAVMSPIAAAEMAVPVAGYSAAGGAMSAGVGTAAQIGTLAKLSVPQSWAAAAPEIRLAAHQRPAAGVAAATAETQMFAGMGGMPELFGATPLVAMGNRDKNGKDSAPDEPEAPASGRRQRLPHYWR